MDYIVFGKKEKKHQIEFIKVMSNAVVGIKFVEALPGSFGTFDLYTSGGYPCDTFKDYGTVFRDEGQTVYLSNDGSVYADPVEPEGPGEPQELYVPTLEELKTSKRREIGAACEQIIYSGINVTLAGGRVEHYSLTEHDQLNLFGKQAQIAAGATRLEYHADGQPCRYFTPTDMAKIVQEAMWHVSYHTTYCNALNMWIASAAASNDLQAITYGADVPVAYQSDVLKAYLKDLTGVANAPG